MDLTSRKPSKKTVDSVDDWLKNEGYFRKHAPNDATCLFKAVSEQIYLSQFHHLKVRSQCVDFMKKNQILFEKNISIPYDIYLKKMSLSSEWGTEHEMQAMSLLYKREFIIYDGIKMKRIIVTNNGSDKFINLCQFGQKHYESIFERETLAAAAYCQSIVYHTLYKRVFKLDGVDEAVDKMLHDRTVNIRHEKFFLKSNIDMRDDLKVELLTKIDDKIKDTVDDSDETLNQDSKMLFPYRIAKALDPNIYRNTDFDVWHEKKRGIRSSNRYYWKSNELQVGCKCYVILEPKETTVEQDNINENFEAIEDKYKDENSNDVPEKTNKIEEENKDENGNIPEKIDEIEEIVTIEKKKMIGHIQHMTDNEGPVVVFIEELGKKLTVPFSALEIIPRPKKSPFSMFNVVSVRRNNYLNNSPYRWTNNNNYNNNNNRKQFKINGNYRKSKDTTIITDLNGYDKLNNNNNNNNNNEVDHNSNEIKKKGKTENSRWHKNSKSNTIKNPTSIMKKLTSIDNFSPKDTINPVNLIEVRPVSVVFDNQRNAPSITSTSPNIQLKNNGSSSSGNPISSDNSNLTSSTNQSSISTNISSSSQCDMNDSSKSSGNRNESDQSNSLPAARSTPVPLQHNDVQLQQLHSQQQQHHQQMTGPSMMPSNTGIVCVSSEGNVYPQYSYYSSFVPESSSVVASTSQPPLEHHFNRINYSAVLSYDMNGTDLPLTDLITLRYFYNLGIETQRYGGYWQSGPSPIYYSPSNVITRGNIMPMMPISDYQSAQIQNQPPQQIQPLIQQQQSQQQQQQLTHNQQQQQQQSQQHQQQINQQQGSSSTVTSSQSNNLQRHNNHTRRRGNDQHIHTGRIMNTNNYGNQKHTYTRKNDTQEINHHRDEVQSTSYDYKSKNNYINSDNKDSHLGNREQQKKNISTTSSSGSNTSVGNRYKKNNDNRNRGYERSGHYQMNNPGNYQTNNNYTNRNISDGAGPSFHRGKLSEINNQSQLQSVNSNNQPPLLPLPLTLPPPVVSSSSSSTSTGGGQSITSTATQFYQNYPPPAYTNVQYIPNEADNYYPSPNGNYYPIPTIVTSHQDIQEANNQQQQQQQPPPPPPPPPGAYVCTGPENFPPPMSPMYQPYVFSQPPIYQNTPPNQGHDQQWYQMHGNQQQPPQFVPSFAHLSISQLPPTINRTPSSN